MENFLQNTLNIITDIKKSDDFMFKPKTEKIEEIAEENKTVIKRLEDILSAPARMYIDYANVRPWSNKLKWHIDLKRLKQFLDSFDTVQAVNFYSGYLEGSKQSKKEIKEAENQKYFVRKKPVKIMQFSIDASSISKDSTALINQFVRKSLLRKFEIATIEYLNERFRDLNKKGEYYIEDRKCNFDVEIGVDMLLDYERNGSTTETFILWSGDSDFCDPLEKLLKAGKKVFLFATAGRIARELNDLRADGLEIFDIFDLKEFICWSKESSYRRTKDSVSGAL